jgi:hypothetical protein
MNFFVLVYTKIFYWICFLSFAGNKPAYWFTLLLVGLSFCDVRGEINVRCSTKDAGHIVDNSWI